ncbi:MAG: hypothetical protein HN341_01470 [Verrucomicrobia bacterium]|jgi:hypothetical protein|nr:hypothetical protein [Verrucomicrobiota bacterium]
MAEQQDESSSRESTSAAGDLVFELNFVPQWARKPADEVRYGSFDDHDSGRGRRGAPRGRSGGRGSQPRQDRGSRDRRPPRRNDGGPPQDRRDSSPRGRGGPPRAQSSYSREPSRGRSFQESVSSVPVNVRFLPEQSALSGLVRQVASTKRAYPLIDLASILMSKPGCCFVKLDVDSPSPEATLYQCKECRTISSDRGQVESHIMSDHVAVYFDIDEVEGEKPSGTFVCVAKCGYSGILLGPPNHHSYAESVRRLHTARFSNMDFITYKERIQLSHNPEDVERWKEEASKSVQYRLKEGSEEEREPMVLTNAERYMREHVIPRMVAVTKRAVVSEDIAHGIKDQGIKRALRDEWQRESRFPLKVSFALRAAFKHKHLHVFKAGKGKGVNFVTAVEPVPLDPSVAIPSIKEVLSYLRENPGCTRQQMVQALRPEAEADSDDVKALLQPLYWLVDRGHIIEFFNGTLSVPLGRH